MAPNDLHMCEFQIEYVFYQIFLHTCSPTKKQLSAGVSVVGAPKYTDKDDDI